MTKQKALEEAQKLGIELKGTETAGQIEALINASKAESKEATVEGADKTADSAEPVEARRKAYYYIVYVDSYANDEGYVLPRGVYKSSQKISRLEASRDRFVAKFVGSIPQNTLHDIANILKVRTVNSDGSYRDSNEVLEEMVQEVEID